MNLFRAAAALVKCRNPENQRQKPKTEPCWTPSCRFRACVLPGAESLTAHCYFFMADLVRQEIAAASHTWVVKVGTRVLTSPDGGLCQKRISSLADELHRLMLAGRRVALVSSGAVAAGLGQLGLTTRPTDLARLQAVAAVGQAHLVE